MMERDVFLIRFWRLVYLRKHHHHDFKYSGNFSIVRLDRKKADYSTKHLFWRFFWKVQYVA